MKTTHAAPAGSLTQTPDKTATGDPELDRLMARAYITEAQTVATNYNRSSQTIKSLCWGLLQTSESPRNLPLLLAFTLAMDLLENEEHKEWWQENKQDHPADEAPYGPSEVIAGFWRGVQGFGQGAPKGVPKAQREAITGAALALVALAPASP